VTGVDVHEDEMTVSAEDGAATVSPVAVALNGCSVRVKELTLRTPSLDDVFLELTGNRIESVDGAGEEREDEPDSHRRSEVRQ
jgi:ABC-2 type transport system ATP-binding protein